MAKRAGKRSGKGVEPPMASCLLLCDDVLVSAGRGKHTLVGVVDELLLPSLPAVAGPYVAYVRLSNVYPKQGIKLVIVEEDGTELLRVNAMPSHSDPLMGHTLIIPLPRFALKTAGRYRLTALHDQVPFVESPIFVKIPREEADDVDDEHQR